jgi:hypothetical protein
MSVTNVGSARRAACTSAEKPPAILFLSNSVFGVSVLLLRLLRLAGAWTIQTPSFCKRQKGYSGW